MKTIPVTVQVQRFLTGRGEWQDFGSLPICLSFNPDDSDWATCLRTNVGGALLDYLSKCAASNGYYRLGEHSQAPVYRYRFGDAVFLADWGGAS